MDADLDADVDVDVDADADLQRGRTGARAPRGAVAIGLLAFAMTAGCSGASVPGRDLGSYAVTGTLRHNTCGLGAPQPWTFSVRLGRDGATLYWNWQDGSPLVSGRLSSGDTVASLKEAATLAADSTARSTGSCTLQSTSDFELTLPPNTPPASFTGTLSYTYAPAPGASCGDVLTAGGGMYDTLPCTLSYDVSATRSGG